MQKNILTIYFLKRCMKMKVKYNLRKVSNLKQSSRKEM